MEEYKPGDVFQITPKHNEQGGRAGWVGAFVMATEIKGWGIVGFVHHVHEHDKPRQVHIRLKWDDIAFVGKAPVVPEDVDTAAK